MILSKKQIYIFFSVALVFFVTVICAFGVVYIWTDSAKEMQKAEEGAIATVDSFITSAKKIEDLHGVDLIPLDCQTPQTTEEKTYAAQVFEKEYLEEADMTRKNPAYSAGTDVCVARFDLDKDGVKEYIANFSSSLSCGTEGCPFRVDTMHDGTLSSLLHESGMIAHIDGVFVVASTTKGMHNLAFMDTSGTKASIFVWDGGKYESKYELSTDATETKTATSSAQSEKNVVASTTKNNQSVILQNGTVLKTGAIIDGLKISDLGAIDEEHPLSSSAYAFIFSGTLSGKGKILPEDKDGLPVLRLETPLLKAINGQGYTDFLIEPLWLSEDILKTHKRNISFTFVIKAGNIKTCLSCDPTISEQGIYITQGQEIKTFPQGNTTIKIEEYGDPIFSFHSKYPFLPRLHITNVWGKKIFEPISEDKQEKTTWGRGKPTDIHISQTGRFISFSLYFSDGFAFPVVYDMKTGENVMRLFYENDDIMFVPEIAWLDDERGFVFTSEWSSYGGDGVDGVFYWHESSPKKITALIRITPQFEKEHRVYENLKIKNGAVTVTERGTEITQDGDNTAPQIKTFPLPI